MDKGCFVKGKMPCSLGDLRQIDKTSQQVQARDVRHSPFGHGNFSIMRLVLGVPVVRAQMRGSLLWNLTRSPALYAQQPS